MVMINIMMVIVVMRINMQSFQINLLACLLIRSASEKSLVICIYPNNVASDNHFNDDSIVNEDENVDEDHHDGNINVNGSGP